MCYISPCKFTTLYPECLYKECFFLKRAWTLQSSEKDIHTSALVLVPTVQHVAQKINLAPHIRRCLFASVHRYQLVASAAMHVQNTLRDSEAKLWPAASLYWRSCKFAQISGSEVVMMHVVSHWHTTTTSGGGGHLFLCTATIPRTQHHLSRPHLRDSMFSPFRSHGGRQGGSQVESEWVGALTAQKPCPCQRF